MKLKDAMDIIAGKQQKKRRYRVTLEWRRGGMLISDYFPERDETPLLTERKAWELADKFFTATFESCPPYGQAVNIYVVYADNWVPVEGYASRMLRKYPQAAPGQDEQHETPRQS